MKATNVFYLSFLRHISAWGVKGSRQRLLSLTIPTKWSKMSRRVQFLTPQDRTDRLFTFLPKAKNV
jgi:hypothetical protein